MIFETSKENIKELLIHQLGGLFLTPPIFDIELIDEVFDRVLEKLEINFSSNPNKYYSRIVKGKREAYFNPYHSGQWTVFLYFMSYELAHYPSDDEHALLLADRVYYLNKVMNSCDLYHQVKLPLCFALDHPQGTVMGRAKYSNGLYFGQCCTVGNNNDIYPEIGENCQMCMNSAILGNSHIGKNVIIGAGALVKDQDVPNNSIVFGQSPNLIIKSR